MTSGWYGDEDENSSRLACVIAGILTVSGIGGSFYLSGAFLFTQEFGGFSFGLFIAAAASTATAIVGGTFLFSRCGKKWP